MNKKYILVILLLFLFASCTSDEVTKKDEADYDVEMFTPELKVDFKEVYSWINLMPGPDAQARFNITGEFEIFQTSDYDFSKMNLTLIKIFQDKELIYSIKPEIRIDDKRSTNESKFIIFGTIKGLLPDPKLNTEGVIDAQFIFTEDDELYSHLIKNVKIDKAY
ncbi:MAG: hypothetical protein M5R37_14510 [Melioribacteraceae bacterium]|nr:hypothetical protein [Melioribacteraceae bacterium]